MSNFGGRGARKAGRPRIISLFRAVARTHFSRIDITNDISVSIVEELVRAKAQRSNIILGMPAALCNFEKASKQASKSLLPSFFFFLW